MSKSENKNPTNNEIMFGSDNPNAIEVKDLVKVYAGKKVIEEVRAVDGISFSITKGELFEAGSHIGINVITVEE